MVDELVIKRESVSANVFLMIKGVFLSGFYCIVPDKWTERTRGVVLVDGWIDIIMC